ncbi:hypothetical protein N9B94_04650 [Verrucomicrobia bacterium]|nr:hypothetical protein [Verrucomicrobiota bacterium]
MKTSILIKIAVSALILYTSPIQAADKKPISREELRKELQGLSPEDREVRIKELRNSRGEQKGLAAGAQESPERKALMEKIKKELEGLSPDERQKKMQELRSKAGQNGKGGFMSQISDEERTKMREEFKNLSPEERRAKIQDFIKKGTGDRQGKFGSQRQGFNPETMKAHIQQLEAKKADGTITDRERQMLERVTSMKNRGGIRKKK